MGMKIISVGNNHGDCFFIEISNEKDKCVIMVDGRKGDSVSYSLIKEKINEYKKIDYIVLTHVDDDHIHGLLKVFQDEELDKCIKRSIIIYNYVSPSVVSYKQADEFEELLQNHTVISTTMRNYTAYSSQCLKIISAELRRELDPDLSKDYAVMTLLHPDWNGIKSVYKNYEVWKKWQIKATKNGDPTDNELINEQSIAFMIEYKNKRVVFTGDGYMKILISKIERFKNFEEKKIDFIKIAHHGAKKNNEGLKEFAENHKCYQFFVTGKEIWDGIHPNKELVKELLTIDKRVKIYSNVKHADLSELRNESEIDIC